MSAAAALPAVPVPWWADPVGTLPRVAGVITGEPTCTIWNGDALHVLRMLPDNSVHAIITDPPYGLSDHTPAQVIAAITAWANGDRERVPDGRGFMGHEWDTFVPPPAIWDECFRVLKPGGHLAVFAGTRTVDLMGLSIRLAGFAKRDTITWMYGNGFPKNLDISKAIDKVRDERHDEALAITCQIETAMRAAGLGRRDLNQAVLGVNHGSGSATSWTTTRSDGAHKPRVPSWEHWKVLRDLLDMGHALDVEVWRLNERKGTPGHDRERQEPQRRVIPSAAISASGFGADGWAPWVTEPASDAAREWDGWGTALKPASEPIILARKPFKGTVAGNVLEHGTGGINIEGCRVTANGRPLRVSHSINTPGKSTYGDNGPGGGSHADGITDMGRWPANVVLSHAMTEDGFDACTEGCIDGCPVKLLDNQTGERPSGGSKHERSSLTTGIYGQYTSGRNTSREPDSGGASRFYNVFRYQAKAPKSERPKINGKGFATVKPRALIEWLVTLLTPPGGTVLDNNAGTGTTGEAAHRLGFDSILIERERGHIPYIRQRFDTYLAQLVEKGGSD